MNSMIALPMLSITCLIVGWNYTKIINKITYIEQLGLAFLMGLGLTTILWFALYRLGLKLDLYTYVLSSFLIWLLGKVVYLFIGKKFANQQIPKLSLFEMVGVFIVSLLIITHFMISSYNPITSWDSIALYDFAGRIISINHSLKDITSSSYYMSYPLMISLNHAVIYMLGGINAQGLHSLIFISLLMIVFGRMYAWTNLRLAIFTTLMVASAYQLYYHSTYAYTNVPYAVFVVTSYLYLVSDDLKENKTSYLLIGSLMLGLSTWVRSSEPFWMIGLILIFWQSLRFKKLGLGLLSICIVLSFRYLWTGFHQQILSTLLIPTQSTVSLFTINAYKRIMTNIPELVWYTLLNVIFPYLGIWLLFIPSILVGLIKRDVRLMQLLLCSIFIFSFLVGGIAIFSTYYTTWTSIGDSAKRMVLFVIPLSIVIGMYAFHLVSIKAKND